MAATPPIPRIINRGKALQQAPPLGSTQPYRLIARGQVATNLLDQGR